MGQSKLPIMALGLAIMVSNPSALAAQSLPDWIEVDSASHTVRLTLAATAAADTGTGLINGHHSGDVQVVVPLGWTVRWSWKNADSSQSHSLVVMAEREKLPLEGGRPALDNALSRSVTQGLKPGQKDETTFVADQAGWYWMLCGVAGHALRGEWISFKVDREATSVAIKQK